MRVRILMILFILLCLTTKAAVLVPKSNTSKKHKRIESIITKTFYDELYKRTKKLKPAIEVKKAKISINDGRRGKLIVEMMKQRNRERLAKKRGLDPSNASSGADLLKQQKTQNIRFLKKMRREQAQLEKKYSHLPLIERKRMIWKEQAQIEMTSLKLKVQKQKGWKVKHVKTLKKWQIDYQRYTGQVDDYKNSLFSIPLVLPVSEKEKKKKIEVIIAKEHFIIDSSLEMKTRDQGGRPTCSSFAGLRAVEILLEQNNQKIDLSEQYFYWSSKPKCQSSKCSKRGSWVGHGFNYSKDSHSINIPTEESCPYIKNNKLRNETQIPLGNNCNRGVVKIDKMEYFKTLDQALDSIKSNRPVVASIKLTPNFYNNKGLVLDSESRAKAKMDGHSSGHAVTFIGYLKLPKILNEGKACFITVNSWGSGWGSGGYACLSEKWLLNHRISNPFVSINSIQM